jgi:hypothetical protein
MQKLLEELNTQKEMKKERYEIILKQRNDYRELICNRKEKENNLLSLIVQDKIDINVIYYKIL